VTNPKSSILHVCSREMIRELRDQILRLHGFEVVSTISVREAPELFGRQIYTLVLIDVEGEGRVSEAEHLCEDIKKEKPNQTVAYVCNHRVAIESDCPDEVIRSEFNPEALVRGVKQLIHQ
jgi:DNA-binding NtrC family response regulator